jgi:hypothetical protein
MYGEWRYSSTILDLETRRWWVVSFTQRTQKITITYITCSIILYCVFTEYHSMQNMNHRHNTTTPFRKMNYKESNYICTSWWPHKVETYRSDISRRVMTDHKKKLQLKLVWQGADTEN